MNLFRFPAIAASSSPQPSMGCHVRSVCRATYPRRVGDYPKLVWDKSHSVIAGFRARVEREKPQPRKPELPEDDE
jgi:hypothetical protein